MDGKKRDTFDFVLLVFLQGATSDDLEMKQDYYDYYSQVPLVHYAIAEKENQGEELQGVKQYLKKSCDKRLFSDEPLIFADLSDATACAASLAEHLD